MKYKGLTIKKTGKLFRVQELKRYYKTLEQARSAVDRWEIIQNIKDRLSKVKGKR
jgi:hypothetical protein